ncbi:uncharacterized protein G2W53_023619 [Senna tora]|uniref:Uncharacterized protein n=1 Tax=Senna tora TaxID=362788 RepID=A0A834WID4_9FABA|nr:uncharacterized protein G2W53_023619 [Senna tora]
MELVGTSLKEAKWLIKEGGVRKQQINVQADY